MRYVPKGDCYLVFSEEEMAYEDTLPPKTYSINFDPDAGRFFLKIMRDFSYDGVLYGDIEQTRDRIIKTFNERDHSTGVLLEGDKGSGKTLLAKLVASKLNLMQDIPTIIVGTAFDGEGFRAFLNSIEQPICVIFDEFEKIYKKKEDQESILSLFDGLYESKKLWLLTYNDRSRVTSFMKNRPGRFFYSLTYNGLDEIFVKSYCDRNLDNKDHMEPILNFCKLTSMSFDMLQAVVEDMNRYKETLHETLKFLNVQAEGVSERFELVEFVPSDEFTKIYNNDSHLQNDEEKQLISHETSACIPRDQDESSYKFEWGEATLRGAWYNSLEDEIDIHVKYTMKSGRVETVYLCFQSENLVKVVDGIYHYKSGDGELKIVKSSYSFSTNKLF